MESGLSCSLIGFMVNLGVTVIAGIVCQVINLGGASVMAELLVRPPSCL